jgi:hypothetical protein
MFLDDENAVNVVIEEDPEVQVRSARELLLSEAKEDHSQIIINNAEGKPQLLIITRAYLISSDTENEQVPEVVVEPLQNSDVAVEAQPRRSQVLLEDKPDIQASDNSSEPIQDHPDDQLDNADESFEDDHHGKMSRDGFRFKSNYFFIEQLNIPINGCGAFLGGGASCSNFVQEEFGDESAEMIDHRKLFAIPFLLFPKNQ